MAPTSALWEHPSESATAALHKKVSRGSDGETPRKRRSARIAAMKKRKLEASVGCVQAPQPAPPPPPPAADQQRLSPPPADTAAAAEAAAQQRWVSRRAGLAHVLWRTMVLMHSNRLLALRVEALKRETSAFVCSVLNNPENHVLVPPTPVPTHQQPASS